MKLRNKDLDEIFEVVTFDYINSGVPNGNGDYPVEFVALEAVDEEGDLYEFKYRSLKDLNVIWEDYTPTEPLIKDEKVRKAVRAWADALEIECCMYDKGINAFAVGTVMINFPGKLRPTLQDGEIYKIAKLCGEGEE